MCGRLNIQGSQLSLGIANELNLDMSLCTNDDLRPTQKLNLIVADSGKPSGVVGQWGIKPTWSKKLLINAQAETVAVKPTFKAAFANARCIVPCTGWYEWKDEGGPKKTKYYFRQENNLPIYMAAIRFHSADDDQVVTLTSSPNAKCAQYHHRMPVILRAEHVKDYLTGSAAAITPLLMPIKDEFVSVSRA